MKQVSFGIITKDKDETDQSNARSPYPTTKVWPEVITNLVVSFFLDTLCINHTAKRPAPKAIKSHTCSVTNPTALPKKLKMASSTFRKMAGNDLTAFPTGILSASANLSNYFFKTPSSLDGEPLAHPPPPETPAMASKNVEKVIEMAVCLEDMVIPVHEIRYKFFQPKIYFYQEPFQQFVSFLQLPFEGLFDFAIVFLILLVFSIQIV